MRITETNRIYHYCKLSTAIEYILPDKQLLLNPLGKTNDPRENRNFIFAGFNIDRRTQFDPKKSNQLISEEIRRDAKVLCFSADADPYFGYELSRMWALYGESHKGVCLELNKEKFIRANPDKIKRRLFKPISYYELDVSRPIDHNFINYGMIDEIGLENYIRRDFRPRNLNQLFFTKNKEWDSEQEFRLIYFSDEKENEYCKIHGCITNIFLGVDFNERYLPAIRHYCKRVPIHKLEFVEVRLMIGKSF